LDEDDAGEEEGDAGEAAEVGALGLHADESEVVDDDGGEELAEEDGADEEDDAEVGDEDDGGGDEDGADGAAEPGPPWCGADLGGGGEAFAHHDEGDDGDGEKDGADGEGDEGGEPGGADVVAELFVDRGLEGQEHARDDGDDEIDPGDAFHGACSAFELAGSEGGIVEPSGRGGGSGGVRRESLGTGRTRRPGAAREARLAWSIGGRARERESECRPHAMVARAAAGAGGRRRGVRR